MPVLDGYEATRRFREDPRLAAVPIIAMTAHALVRERDKCLQGGMNDYVSKPVDPQVLYAVLARWIRPGGAEGGPEGPPRPAGSGEGLGAWPGLDVDMGLKYADGREDDYRRRLSRFLALKAGAAEEIRMALAAGDLEGAGRSAHSMIAIAGTLGAVELSERARSLQDAIDGRDLPAMGPLLDRFEESLARVVQGLKHL